MKVFKEGVLGERNVSRSRRPQKGRTPRSSGRLLPPVSILIDGAFVEVAAADLRPFFVRRSSDAMQRIQAATERARALDEELATARAMRRLRREMREWERAGVRRHRIRVAPPPPRKPVARARNSSLTRLTRWTKALPTYRKVIVDRQGQRGIFLDIRYDAARTNRTGVNRRRLAYQLRRDHAELYLGEPVSLSNMGANADEILACADALESVNRAARSNAKVGLNAILQCPYELDAAGRGAYLERVARLFDDMGVAYCMTLHEPDIEGDQRNYHVHIWWTLRAIERVGPYEWDIAEQLRTDLDGPLALRDLRRACADVATQTCRAHGHEVTFTHLSNAERGLTHRPVKKLGARKVRRARRGEIVADVEANRAIIADNEQRETDLRRKARQQTLQKYARGGEPKLTRATGVRGISRTPMPSRIPVRPARHQHRSPIKPKIANAKAIALPVVPVIAPLRTVAPSPVRVMSPAGARPQPSAQRTWPDRVTPASNQTIADTSPGRVNRQTAKRAIAWAERPNARMIVPIGALANRLTAAPVAPRYANQPAIAPAKRGQAGPFAAAEVRRVLPALRSPQAVETRAARGAAPTETVSRIPDRPDIAVLWPPPQQDRDQRWRQLENMVYRACPALLLSAQAITFGRSNTATERELLGHQERKRLGLPTHETSTACDLIRRLIALHLRDEERRSRNEDRRQRKAQADANARMASVIVLPDGDMPARPRDSGTLEGTHDPVRASPKLPEAHRPDGFFKQQIDPLAQAVRSRNRLVAGWAQAVYSGQRERIKRAAQLIRADEEAERFASGLDPSLWSMIIADAPERHVRTKGTGPARMIGQALDRDFGIQSD